MSGVIPPIFASSLLLFPATMASFFGTNSEGPLGSAMQSVAASLGYGQPLHLVIYAVLIIFFCFFYTALVFNSRDTADNLKKSGAFIPGIRPGQQTGGLHRQGAHAPDAVGRPLRDGRVPVAGNPGFLAGRAVSVRRYFAADCRGGGDGFHGAVQAHLMSHQYPGLMKKANLLGAYGRATGFGVAVNHESASVSQEDLQELQDRAPPRAWFTSSATDRATSSVRVKGFRRELR